MTKLLSKADSVLTITSLMFIGIIIVGGIAIMIQMFKETPTINTYEMTETIHTFRHYNNWLDAIKGQNHTSEMELPVVDGNYPLNPSKKDWNKYLLYCIADDQNFTYQEYMIIMQKIQSGKGAYHF
ncbi:MAG: hypothetical protein KAS32_09690 [Candidatus Peribacteraceae bacterium]|nr:hypothetical protein [Candidatus Peribacteraceae bacterium]